MAFSTNESPVDNPLWKPLSLLVGGSFGGLQFLNSPRWVEKLITSLLHSMLPRKLRILRPSNVRLGVKVQPQNGLFLVGFFGAQILNQNQITFGWFYFLDFRCIYEVLRLYSIPPKKGPCVSYLLVAQEERDRNRTTMPIIYSRHVIFSPKPKRLKTNFFHLHVWDPWEVFAECRLNKLYYQNFNAF